MGKWFVFLLTIISWPCLAQQNQQVYSTANGHSHNDYEKPVPFWKAWENGFGSIEADIFLVNDELIVAHDSSQLAGGRTLKAVYLEPLQQCISRNKGFVYCDTSRHLQLMIDIKSAAVPTLSKLVELLKGYPLLKSCTSLQITVSGRKPVKDSFNDYPSWIGFDGELYQTFNEAALKKIVMLSDNFKRYSQWNGKDPLPENDGRVLTELINKAHALNKTVRFWNAPDSPVAWNTFMKLGVDFINTDDIAGFSLFLKQAPPESH